MFGEQFVAASKTLWTWVAIICGSFLGITFVVCRTEWWLDLVWAREKKREYRQSGYAGPYYDKEYAEEMRHSRFKKWRRKVKRLNRRRAKREFAAFSRRTRRKAIDAVANTLASHEELLESLYGKGSKPL